MRLAVILVLVFLYVALPVSGQNPFISNDSIVIVERTLKKVNKNVNFAIVPGPVFGTSEKLGFAILPMIVYNLNKTDTVSPPSSTAVMLYFDFYGSWMSGLKQSFYWNQNKWRAFVTLGVGSLKLKYYGIGNDTSIINNNDSNYVWTKQKELDFTITCFRKIYRGLYGGLETRYNLANYQGTDSASSAILTNSVLTVGKISQLSLVPVMVWDNRDNIFWSTRGYYASISFQYSNRMFFKSKDYSVISGWVNGYHSLLRRSTRMILAWHFFFQAGSGDFPYRTYANYCRGDNATGYTGGKYVNYSEAAVQTELRYDLWKFIAFGGYLGTGKTFSSYTEFGQSAWLHYGGVRLYVNIIPYRNIRLRLEAAKGRKDYGFYIGIGQGF
ncbi:MAG: hypothetical protein ACOYNC_08805 [Bacteroidales bacterium]